MPPCGRRRKLPASYPPGQPSISIQRNGVITPHSFGVRMAGGSKPFPCWVFFAFGAGATTCGFPPVHFPATAEYLTVPGGLRLIRPSWNASPKWTLKSPVAPSGAVISMFPNATFPKSSRTMPAAGVVTETGACSTSSTGAACIVPRQARDRMARMVFMLGKCASFTCGRRRAAP